MVPVEQQVIGWLVGIGIVIAGPAAIGFFVLGRREDGRSVAVCLGALTLLLGLGAYAAVVQGLSLEDSCPTDMCGVNAGVLGYGLLEYSSRGACAR